MTNAADAGTGEMTSRNLDEAAGGQCCGFYYRELVALFLSVVMPVSDAWSDMFVLVGWYYDGQHGWFTIGVLIHIIAGTLSGCLCAAWELSPRTEGAMAALWFPFGIIIGVAGMAPVVSAAVAISDGGEESNREQIERDFVFLKAIKAVELIFESLPQAAVQCYVGVSYGYLDPGAVNFSPLLTASVSIALFNAGATIMGTEAMGRNLVLPSNYHRISLMSSYGAITAAWRFPQVSTFILWLSLFTCNSKALGAIPATVGVLTLGAMVWEAGFERSEPETQSLKKARFLAHIHLANIAAMIFLFLYEGPLPGLPQPWEPAANNYMNQSAPETDELGALQHYRCQARTSVIVPAVVFAIISPVLMHISLNNDPQHGNTELKEVVVYLEKEVAEMRFLTRADFGECAAPLESAAAARYPAFFTAFFFHFTII